MPLGHPAGTWPGDAPLSVDWTARLRDGGPLAVNLSCLRSSPHNGTHADAPYHVLEDGARSEAFPLDPFLGGCAVVDATGEAGAVVGPEWAERILATRPHRVLIKTRTGPPPDRFPKPFRGLHPDLVSRLVDAGVRLVGTDAPSVDRPDLHGLESHRRLFRAGAFNLENLDLSSVEAGQYELVAVPLKVSGLCAAPVRALLRHVP
jgi:arylformamidase